MFFPPAERGGNYFFFRRDGTVIMFSLAGRDGNCIFLRRGGTVNIFFSAERDGKYIFLLACCKVHVVVYVMTFPHSLLVARREPSRRGRFSSRTAASKLREVLPLQRGRRVFVISFHLLFLFTPAPSTLVAVPAIIDGYPGTRGKNTRDSVSRTAQFRFRQFRVPATGYLVLRLTGWNSSMGAPHTR